MEFTFKKFWWQADAQFPIWSDFTEGDTISLTFAPEGRDDAPMDAREIALTTWVHDNHERQKLRLLTAVLEAYPGLRRQFFDDNAIEADEAELPTITSADGLAAVMTLEEVFVHQISKESVPYVGYQFSSRWAPEHGAGILMHDQRIVEFGGADTAFLLWIAEDDHDN